MHSFSIRQFVRHHIGLEHFPGTPGHCLAMFWGVIKSTSTLVYIYIYIHTYYTICRHLLWVVPAPALAVLWLRSWPFFFFPVVSATFFRTHRWCHGDWSWNCHCVFSVLCDLQITAIPQLIHKYSRRNATASSVSSLEDDNDGNLW